MALAGPRPSARDRREFQLMAAEKVAAFYESWGAMYAEMTRMQLEIAASLLRSVWFPWASNRGFPFVPRTDIAGRALTLLGKGMAPVSRRAVGNARRLSRTKRR
jgi:hypothetical protein